MQKALTTCQSRGDAKLVSLSNSHLKSYTALAPPPPHLLPLLQFLLLGSTLSYGISLCSAWLCCPSCVPHPTSCPAPAYALGWWMGRAGGRRSSPKAGGQQANSCFLSSIKEKGLVSGGTARVEAQPSTLTRLQLQLFNTFKTVQTKY